MKRKLVLFFSFFILVLSQNINAADGTKYPIVLAHGMAASAEIAGVIDYWWGIDDALAANGFEVYKTSVNGMDSTAAKAAAFKQQFMDILAQSGKDKLNIIGHSHGTIYTRYAITNLGLAPYVASHTSIAGPHRGSSIADILANTIPEWFRPFVGGSFNFIYSWVFGDQNPDTVQNTLDLTTNYMTEVFNPNTPNMENVYYQSWAAKVKWGCPSILLQGTWLIMLAKEGANDGLVGVESSKWGNFRGVKSGAWYSAGVDHLNIVDQLFGITPGFDAPGFFVDIANDLKDRGY